jgi:hypothetical protein
MGQTAILLSGTFVNPGYRSIRKQKPFLSQEIFWKDWT